MIVLLSPAKTLDFESEAVTSSASQPEFLEEASQLIAKLKKLSSKQIQSLMSVNPDIAELNVQRFQTWETPFHNGNAKQAMLSFTGEVYRGLNANTFNEPDFEFAQAHIRILSGLYGVLKPLDLIQPYRLEMGTSLKYSAKVSNLYQFWGDKIKEYFESENIENQAIINLSSNEYFKSIRPKEIKNRIIHCHFKDFKDGEYKMLMTYAKNARGAMARYIVKNQIESIEGLKGFDLNGYSFNANLSDETNFTFTRDQILN